MADQEATMSAEQEASADLRSKVRRTIVANSQLNEPYLVMNGLATAVASYGLLADSTAVVIGAMIIAMLLGPIMGLALALVDGDLRLLRQSLIAEGVGAAMVLAMGFLIGRMHHSIPITNEVLSRTTPNLLDLAVALFGGAAGAYATVSPRVSVGLVGVAISTALVPPLASSGICLSRGLFAQAGGAFLLFATNLVAIQCASSIVLYLFGFHSITRRPKDDSKYVQRLLVDAAAFIGLAVFLSYQLTATIGRQSLERRLKDRLTAGVFAIPGAQIAEVQFIERGTKLIVVATVRAPNSITPIQTASLESGLQEYGRSVELHVRSVLTKETTSKGYVHVTDPGARPVDAAPESSRDSSTRTGETPPSPTSAPTDGEVGTERQRAHLNDASPSRTGN